MLLGRRYEIGDFRYRSAEFFAIRDGVLSEKAG